MKKLASYIVVFLPFLYAAYLSISALRPFASNPRVLDSSALIPFVSFLPMAFFFVGVAITGYVNRLETRVAELEKRLATKGI